MQDLHFGRISNFATRLSRHRESRAWGSDQAILRSPRQDKLGIWVAVLPFSRATKSSHLRPNNRLGPSNIYLDSMISNTKSLVVAAQMQLPKKQTTPFRTGFVLVLGFWHLAILCFLTLAGLEDSKLAVMSKMLWGLTLLWIVGFGVASVALRDKVRDFGRRNAGNRVAIFFGFVTLLALLEEAITTGMTNCAPLFGAEIGEVYITASANFLDVVLYHSLVVFLPQFLAWGLLLKRYSFSPFAAFVCYGLTGFVNEALFSGPNPLMLAQWILVYGLLVYLPSQLFFHCSDRRQPRWWMYPIVVLLPILASIPMVVLLLNVIAPGHPSIHFPPM